MRQVSFRCYLFISSFKIKLKKISWNFEEGKAGKGSVCVFKGHL